MSQPYEHYNSECPRCGYPETRDDGPYEPHWADASLSPPLDPRTHLMWCGRCGKPFDACPAEDPESATRPIDAETFAALCNLLHSTHCDQMDLTAAEAGDVLLYGANRCVCDHSRLMARVILAYLGLQFADDESSRVDIASLNAHLAEIGAEMRLGQGALDIPDDDEIPADAGPKER